MDDEGSGRDEYPQNYTHPNDADGITEIINILYTKAEYHNSTEKIETRDTVAHFLFIALVSITLISNVVVIYLIQSKKNLQTTVNLFLINISLADIISTTVYLPFTYTSFMNGGEWIFGHSFCKINYMIYITTLYTTILMFIVIATDRYRAIKNPKKMHKSKFAIALIAIEVWSLSAILAAPLLLWVRYDMDELLGGYCTFEWPNLIKKSEYELAKIVPIAHEIIVCVLPVLWTAFIRLWVRCSFSVRRIKKRATPSELDEIRSNERAISAVMYMSILVMCFWIPLNAMDIVLGSKFDFIESKTQIDAFLGAFWLTMSHGMYRPLFYFWLDSKIIKHLGFGKPRTSVFDDESTSGAVQTDNSMEKIYSTQGNRFEPSEHAVTEAKSIINNFASNVGLMEAKIMDIEHRINSQYRHTTQPYTAYSSATPLGRELCVIHEHGLSQGRMSFHYEPVERNLPVINSFCTSGTSRSNDQRQNSCSLTTSGEVSEN